MGEPLWCWRCVQGGLELSLSCCPALREKTPQTSQYDHQHIITVKVGIIYIFNSLSISWCKFQARLTCLSMRVAGWWWWCLCLLATPTSAQHQAANFAPISASIASQHFLKTGGQLRSLEIGRSFVLCNHDPVAWIDWCYWEIFSKCYILTFYNKNYKPWLMTDSVEEYKYSDICLCYYLSV